MEDALRPNEIRAWFSCGFWFALAASATHLDKQRMTKKCCEYSFQRVTPPCCEARTDCKEEEKEEEEEEDEEEGEISPPPPPHSLRKRSRCRIWLGMTFC